MIFIKVNYQINTTIFFYIGACISCLIDLLLICLLCLITVKDRLLVKLGCFDVISCSSLSVSVYRSQLKCEQI